jgi:hypothetical protein
MLTVPPEIHAKILAGKPPVIRAYSRNPSLTPAYFDTIDIDLTGPAFHALKTTDYLVRFRYRASGILDCQRIPNAAIADDWTGYSWIDINIGTTLDPYNYVAFKIGTDLVCAWFPPLSTYWNYKYSTDQGATWSTTIPIAAATILKLAVILDYGLFTITSGEAHYYSYNSTTHLFTYIEYIHPAVAAGLSYLGTLHAFAPGLHWYKPLAGWTNQPANILNTLNQITITTFGNGWWFYISALNLDSSTYTMLAFTGDFQSFYLIPSSVNGPFCHFDDNYYYTCNGQRYQNDYTLNPLPTVRSYSYNIDGCTIHFAQEPTIPAEHLSIVIYRGPNEDNLFPTQPFYNPIVIPQASIINRQSSIVTAYSLPHAPIALLQISSTFSYVLNSLLTQNNITGLGLDPNYEELHFGNADPAFFQGLTSDILHSLAAKFFHFLAPRSTNIYLRRPYTLDDIDLEITLPPNTLPSYLVTPIPYLSLITGTDSTNAKVTAHQVISESGVGMTVHDLAQHDETEYPILLPLLIQYYSFFHSPRILLFCFPHLAAEIGDTAQFSETQKGLIIDIHESYKSSPSPAWQQTITLADIKSL